MDPNARHNLSPIWHLCILTLITRKLLVIYGRCKYWTTALLLKISIFCVKAGFEIWLPSYGSKHSSQFLSNKPFVHPYMHNLKTTGYNMDIQRIEWLLYYQSHSWYGLELQESCSWRATGKSQMAVSLSASLREQSDVFSWCHTLSSHKRVLGGLEILAGLCNEEPLWNPGYDSAI